MEAEEKLLEVSESDQSFEEFYQGLFGPFAESGRWEFDGNYEVFIEALGRAKRSQIEAEQVTQENRTEDEDVGGTPIFEYGNALLRLEREESGDNILSGGLEYHPEDIDNEKEAESGSLLSELRNTYQQIVKNYQTDYIQPKDEPKTSDLEAPEESILSVTIPADYDPETYQETADAITSIAAEIENLHRSMKTSVSGYESHQ